MADHDTALVDTDADPDSDRLIEVHKRALSRFDDTVTPQLEQRSLSLMARRFATIPGAQWEGDFGTAFDASFKMEVNKVARGVEKIITDYRQNRIAPDFRPAAGKGDQDTADTLDGLHRADGHKFKSQAARDNAFEEAALGGFGAYRLTEEYDDPYDKDSDALRINPAMTIVDADQSVFFDGNSKEYDKHDARFAFIVTAMTVDAFEEAYPDAKGEWDTALPMTFDWFTPDIRRIAEYYEVEDDDQRLLILSFPLTGEEQRHWQQDIPSEDVADLKAKGWKQRTSKRKRRRVHKYVLSGAEVVKDQGYIAGDQIPIVPVYGKRWYVDNQERWRGHVQLKMDAQRIYNSKVSKLQETDVLAPREIPIFAPDQMPPALQEIWKNMNLERHPYALALPLMDGNGQIVSMGPIGKIEPPSVPEVTAALIQIANNDLTEEDQDGADEVKANVSADAMDIAAQRVDAKTEIYLDNMRLSVEREGEIYLSKAGEVYYEAGRVVETMSEDGDDGTATLKESFTNKQGLNIVRNDFGAGRYKVIAVAQEATATRRDKTVRSCLNTAAVAQEAGDTELATVAALTAVMNQDGEGMSDMQNYARKRLVAMGVVPPNEEEQAQMEEAQQRPDPTAALAEAQGRALAAQSEKDHALAGKAVADTKQSIASSILKLAQAHAVGGSAEAPEAPDGLQVAKTIAEIDKHHAEADSIRSKTMHLPAELSIEAHNAETKRMHAERANDNDPRIRKGRELAG